MGINSCRKAESRQKINYWSSEESRRKMVDKIMDTLLRHMPRTGLDGTNELRKIAVRFEDKIFKVTGNQQEYLRKISFKMRALEPRANARFGNHIPGNSFGNNQRPLNPATGGEGREGVYEGQWQLDQPLDDQPQGEIEMVVEGGPPPQGSGFYPHTGRMARWKAARLSDKWPSTSPTS